MHVDGGIDADFSDSRVSLEVLLQDSWYCHQAIY